MSGPPVVVMVVVPEIASSMLSKMRDATVSRRHVRLMPAADGLHVQDLGSKNGTFAGGVRIQEIVLDRALTLDVGRVSLQLLVNDEDLGNPVGQEAFGALTTQGGVKSEFMKPVDYSKTK